MNTVKICLGLAVFLFLSGCQTSASCSSATGEYSYSAFNESGEAVVTGTIHLTIADNEISGTWNLQAVDNAGMNQTGPQIGHGRLAGSITQDAVTINLNPEMADNNVFLNGNFRQQNLYGNWSYSGLAGTLAEGQFVADKKSP